MDQLWQFCFVSRNIGGIQISMALLQIAEPGQTPQPHQRRLAVGIDLGTTNSLVAAVRSGRSEPLPDADGQVILPSAVRYSAEGTQVGHGARAAAGSPARTRVADPHGQVHHVLVEPNDPAATLEEGDTVRLVRREGHVFRAILHSTPRFENWID